MQKELQAIIFDLDGVIVDTFELYYITNKRIAELLSLPFTREDNGRFRGIGRKEIIEELVLSSGKPMTKQEKEKLAESKNDHYKQLINSLDESFILPGMKNLILDVKKHGIKIGIASSSTNGKTVLKKVGLYHYTDYIVDPTKLLKGKPDPEIFIKAADSLSIQHENCVAIEDGEAGLQAIKHTKMFSVGIGESEYMKSADWHVKSTKEITFEELLIRFKG